MEYEVQDFDVDVIKRSRTVPVLVDFWAEWCGPCRTLGPVLERLAGKANGRWVLAKVDTDHSQEVAARYGIRSIPNVKLFVDGEVTNEFTGALPESAVVQWLERALPDPLRNEIARAEELLRSGRVLEAQAALATVIAQSPDHERARVVLAGTFLESAPGKAIELLRGIEEDSKEFPIADAIRTFAAMTHKLERPDELPAHPVRGMYLEALHALGRREYDLALEKFIEVIRTDRDYDDDGARKAVVAVFKVLGEESPITRKYRRIFSSALFV
jgi:putative thioredoxin